MADALQEIVQKALADVLDAPLANLRQSLADRLSLDVQAAQVEASDQAGRAARMACAEALNVAARRLRQASSITEIGATLLETAGSWAGRVALLVHKGDTLTGWRAFGFEDAGTASGKFAEAWTALQVSLADAPALAQTVQTREAVVSLSVPDHLSAALVDLLGLAAEDKVYLFPLCLRQSVVAVLYADDVRSTTDVQPAALELLCAVSELAIEALSTRPRPREQGAEPESGRLELPSVRQEVRSAAPDWEGMPPDVRDVHLRAQRFARVLVADLQLYRSQEIREGKRNRNIYGRLQDEIDKSREVYLRKFGQSAAGGVDYFHLELVHNLAENQEELLGPDYPGPTVASAVG